MCPIAGYFKDETASVAGLYALCMILIDLDRGIYVSTMRDVRRIGNGERHDADDDDR